MKAYTKEEATERINQLAAAGKEFAFIINYKQDCSYIEEPDNIDPTEWLYNLNGFTNYREAVKPTPSRENILWQSYPNSFSAYQQSFNIVRKNILVGNSFLVNLTCSTPVSTNLNLKEIFYQSKALYKLWLKDRFVCFSPEIFVRISRGQIYAYPMKGTIDATLPKAKEQLMNDVKEAAEHATITDLIRNDLSIVAEQVEVLRYRYVDRLQTNRGSILQTSSEIKGKLPYDYLLYLGNILFKLLPAGSITGAPKLKTIEIIAEAEEHERSFYTGIMGYFDGKSIDSSVMIRFIEQRNNRLFFKSGGGITSQSNVNSEYQEMIQKVYVPIY
ncbi:aminodeoxychorismate synthase component I [uncultured Bacteroides sp.]|uniref:aminodeoxychorismate synthase component I n=1 Tax=uncultured Bacteroides sp. TaxID=162156 RepID=UPI002AA73662|nr:aminodeoxychorismate synthase component I [uncultured Bacteroides sp.]